MSGIIGHDPESPVRFDRNTPPGLALHLSFAGLSCPPFSGEPMPAKRSAMRKIKDVLRLKFEAKLSHERIAAATGISKGAVTNYVQRAVQKGLGWPLPADLDEGQLEGLLFRQNASRALRGPGLCPRASGAQAQGRHAAVAVGGVQRRAR